MLATQEGCTTTQMSGGKMIVLLASARMVRFSAKQKCVPQTVSIPNTFQGVAAQCVMVSQQVEGGSLAGV